ncbi:MAG: DUF502 domain-containing protein [Ignavibacteria bacterium]
MSRINSFIKTTILGGSLIVLPIVIWILVFKWLFEFVFDKVKPITDLILKTSGMQEFAASILAIILILLTFFLIGLLIKTKLGQYSFEIIEPRILARIPLYKIIKETVLQLIGSNKTLFKHVALVSLFGNDTLTTAFVTDEHENGYYTVFIPPGPAPTAGFIFHVKKENVHIINYPVDKAMKSIISIGVGSKELLSLYKTK